MKFLLAKKNKFLSFSPDALGMATSFVCLIHCLFLPLLLILQPILFSFVKDLQDNEWWEWLDFVFLAVGLLAVILATQKAMKSARKIAFYVAYAIFAAGILLDENWIIFSYIGSFGLANLHLKNYREHKQHCKI
jgi:predicted lysophospholipase L1 biosynthesis ABC-type transport system permease subunit